MARKRTSEPEVVLSAAAPAPVRRVAKPRPKHVAAKTETLPTPVSKAAAEPTQDDISLLAYTYWEARGFQGGSPEEDWLRAERELFGA